MATMIHLRWMQFVNCVNVCMLSSYGSYEVHTAQTAKQRCFLDAGAKSPCMDALATVALHIHTSFSHGLCAWHSMCIPGAF